VHAGKVYAKYLEKDSAEQIIQPKLYDTECGFCPGRSTTKKISFSSKFLRNVGSMPKTSTHVLSNTEKHG